MPESRASAVWEGELVSGSGRVGVQSGAFPELPVTWAARTQRPNPKTSPEELLAAAHAACYAMAFAHTLATAGHAPDHLAVEAVCQFTPVESGFAVSAMDVDAHGRVPGIDQAAFAGWAREAEQGCPISNAIRGNVAISLTATLDA